MADIFSGGVRMIDVYWAEHLTNTIRVDVIKDWTWEEFQQLVGTSITMANDRAYGQVNRPRIDYIFDFRYADFYPRPTFHLVNLHLVAQRQPSSTGVIAVISNQLLITTMFQTSQKLSEKAQRYYQLVPNLKHAEWLITVSRATTDNTI